MTTLLASPRLRLRPKIFFATGLLVAGREGFARGWNISSTIFITYEKKHWRAGDMARGGNKIVLPPALTLDLKSMGSSHVLWIATKPTIWSEETGRLVVRLYHDISSKLPVLEYFSQRTTQSLQAAGLLWNRCLPSDRHCRVLRQAVLLISFIPKKTPNWRAINQMRWKHGNNRAQEVQCGKR